MSVSIIEKFIEGKTGDLYKCEDQYVFNNHFAAVVDGATNVTGGLFHNKAPGRLAAEVIRETIESLPANADLTQLMATINFNLQSVYEKYDISKEIEKNKWMAPSASLIVYSKFYQEVWQIGDCQAMIDDKLYKNEKIIDDITANARSMYLEAELKQGKTIEDLLVHDTGWEYIRPLIKQQYYLQNDPDNQYGFAVVNGFPIKLSKIVVIKVPRDAKTLVLASDGYPYLKSTLQDSEVELKRILKEDPLCYRLYKSSKGLKQGNLSFDDRVYLKLKL